MECPLYSPEGERRSLHTIEFADLSQLTDIEEGYAVEYKEVLDKAVKAKLPKVIASFANAGGGWIFIGAKNDGTVTCIEAPRTDYGQTIGQIVHHHIQPIPRFDCRFIKSPDDVCKGVLVIEVQESVQPPYLANGNVYVRVGSNADVFAEKADSYMLIDLQRKARAFKDELDEFCRRTVYFPPHTIKEDGSYVYTFPVFNVYLKRLYAQKETSIPFAAFDDAVETMTKAFEVVYKEPCFCQHAHDSLLFRRVIGNCADDVAPIVQLYYDGSIKLCAPVSMLQEHEHERGLEHLSSIRPIRNKSLVRIIDGFSSVAIVMQACQVIDGYLKLRDRSTFDYAVATEFENMQGMMVEFKTQEFDRYAAEFGLPFVGTIDERTHPQITSSNDGDEPFTIEELATTAFYESFGLPIATANEDVKKKTLHIMLGDLADRAWDDIQGQDQN